MEHRTERRRANQRHSEMRWPSILQCCLLMLLCSCNVHAWTHCAGTDHEYLYISITKSWDQAATYCSSQYPGSTLAAPRSDTENTCLNTNKPHGVTAWIGIRYNSSTGAGNYYTADDKMTVQYVKWASGEPSAAGLGQYCVDMWYSPPKSNGELWDNEFCSLQFPFLCQRSARTQCAGCDYEYVYVSIPKSWDQASTYCSSKYPGSTLAAPRSDTENACLNATKPSAIINTWIGIKYSISTGNRTGKYNYYTTDDNKTVQYVNWARGQPDQVPNSNCVNMWYATTSLSYGDLWDNAECKWEFPFFCQFAIWTRCAGTKYDHAFVANHMRRDQARAYCSSRYSGSTLAVPRSHTENTCINATKPSGVTTWIALQHNTSTGDRSGTYNYYTTDDNKPVQYVNWANGQPDGAGGTSQNCVTMWYGPKLSYGGLWDNERCDNYYAFFCQRSVPPIVTTASRQSTPATAATTPASSEHSTFPRTTETISTSSEHGLVSSSKYGTVRATTAYTASTSPTNTMGATADQTPSTSPTNTMGAAADQTPSTSLSTIIAISAAAVVMLVVWAIITGILYRKWHKSSGHKHFHGALSGAVNPVIPDTNNVENPAYGLIMPPSLHEEHPIEMDPIYAALEPRIYSELDTAISAPPVPARRENVDDKEQNPEYLEMQSDNVQKPDYLDWPSVDDQKPASLELQSDNAQKPDYLEWLSSKPAYLEMQSAIVQKPDCLEWLSAKPAHLELQSATAQKSDYLEFLSEKP